VLNLALGIDSDRFQEFADAQVQCIFVHWNLRILPMVSSA
jgi:hypothetical protein